MKIWLYDDCCRGYVIGVATREQAILRMKEEWADEFSDNCRLEVFENSVILYFDNEVYVSAQAFNVDIPEGSKPDILYNARIFNSSYEETRIFATEAEAKGFSEHYYKLGIEYPAA